MEERDDHDDAGERFRDGLGGDRRGIGGGRARRSHVFGLRDQTDSPAPGLGNEAERSAAIQTEKSKLELAEKLKPERKWSRRLEARFSEVWESAKASIARFRSLFGHARASAEELKAVPATLKNEDEQLTAVRSKASAKDLIGLSFSGGGIRSGTFAVGFLQGLAYLRLLRRIDYLSTVSGGGYAGGWLAAWLKREGSIAEVETQLMPNRCLEANADRAFLSKGEVVNEEPEPLHHLRRYSSYMAPRIGWLTVDTWTIIAIWTRNVAINMLMLLPLATALVLAARLVVSAYALIKPTAIVDPVNGSRSFAWVFFGVGLVNLFVGMILNSLALRGFRQARPIALIDKILRSKDFVYYCVLFPLFAATVLLSVSVGATARWVGDLSSTEQGWLGMFVAGSPGLLEAPSIIGHAAALGGVIAFGAILVNKKTWPRLVTIPGLLVVLGLIACLGLAIFASKMTKEPWPMLSLVAWLVLPILAIATIELLGILRFVFAAFMAGASAGVLVTVLEAISKSFHVANRPDLLAAFVPPLGSSDYRLGRDGRSRARWVEGSARPSANGGRGSPPCSWSPASFGCSRSARSFTCPPRSWPREFPYAPS